MQGIQKERNAVRYGVLGRLPRWGGLLCLLLFSVWGTRAAAGGFKIQDQGARAMGMIDAFVAGADDASSVYYNPAGLTRLARPQLIVDGYLAHAVTRYNGRGETDESDGKWYTLPWLYFGVPMPGYDDVAVGIGVYTPFGLGSRWADDSLVRHYTTLAEIRLVNINPSVAWQCTERLSIGAGLDFYTSRVLSRRMADYSLFGGGDGQVKMDADGRGWGYNLGLQYRVTDRITLGFTWRSPVKVGYDGDVQFDNVPPALAPLFGGTHKSYDVDAQIDYPGIAAGAIAWQATDKLRIEFAAEWSKWSTRDTQAINIHGPAVVQQPPQELGWKNSWVLMLGAEYQLNERWSVRCGYGFNETPAPPSTADPSIPTGNTHAVSVGLGYRINEHARLDTALVLAYGEGRTLDNPNAPPHSDFYSLSGYYSIGITYEF